MNNQKTSKMGNCKFFEQFSNRKTFRIFPAPRPFILRLNNFSFNSFSNSLSHFKMNLMVFANELCNFAARSPRSFAGTSTHRGTSLTDFLSHCWIGDEREREKPGSEFLGLLVNKVLSLFANRLGSTWAYL